MAASLGARGRRRGRIVGINVTPMVDVTLVLLVIMMVSATYIVSRALNVELPKSATSDEGAQGPLTVTLTKDHQMFIDQQLIAECFEGAHFVYCTVICKIHHAEAALAQYAVNVVLAINDIALLVEFGG